MNKSKNLKIFLFKREKLSFFSINNHQTCKQTFNTSFYISELNKNPVEGFSAGLVDDNDIFRWEVLIIGPPDTL